MKERPISEITPPQGEAGGRKRPNEDETRVRHEGEEWKSAGGGLTAPKRDENERSLQGRLTDDTAGVNEARARFITDPSSDERQMHLNVVKCSN
ncbi:hypothetical protein TNCV_2265821 [Trichonephila clavipes]|nr:hypothetical protein TNCV_2265821 [Trichonephila clavipes]